MARFGRGVLPIDSQRERLEREICMHGGINTANRYEKCDSCERESAFDRLLGWCTNTGCKLYFGIKTPVAGRP